MATPRPDVWSLGATVFHMLGPAAVRHGRPPARWALPHRQRGAGSAAARRRPDGPAARGDDGQGPAQRWTMTEVRDFLGGPTRGTVPIRPVAPAPVLAPTPASGRPRGDRRPLLVLAGLMRGRGGRRGAACAAARRRRPLGPGRGQRADEPLRAPPPTRHPRRLAGEPPGPDRCRRETFVRDHVAALSTDPDTAWTMLTPSSSARAGACRNHRDFWSGVGDADLLEVTADPQTLVVGLSGALRQLSAPWRAPDRAVAGPTTAAATGIDGEQTEGPSSRRLALATGGEAGDQVLLREEEDGASRSWTNTAAAVRALPLGVETAHEPCGGRRPGESGGRSARTRSRRRPRPQAVRNERGHRGCRAGPAGRRCGRRCRTGRGCRATPLRRALGDGVEVAAHHPGAERHRHRAVGDHQRVQLISPRFAMIV